MPFYFSSKPAPTAATLSEYPEHGSGHVLLSCSDLDSSV
jgi:hypothetical protein